MSVSSLHLAARRHCVDRIAHWTNAYASLARDGRNRIENADGSWTYSEDAYRIFPRYNVLAAIRSTIERWVPSDFPSLDDARAKLIDAGRMAQNSFTEGKQHPIAALAIEEERESFVRFVEASNERDWAAVAPLPFRRVLHEDEADRLYRDFCARWGRWYGGAVEGSVAEPYLTLHVAIVDALPAKEHTIRAMLHALGVVRLFEVREHGDSFELELAAAGLSYDGAEGFWFVHAMDWMIYASHESSITFGGERLITAARQAVPELDRYTYRGWDHPPSGQ